MNANSCLSQLISSACPSIQYRLRKELLCQPPERPEMAELQNQIRQDEAVKRIAASQASDGWLAWTFHGYDSMESGIRLLCEKGLEAEQPVLSRALAALEKYTDRLARGLSKVGKMFDERGFGGGETIRAHLFAHAGKEELTLVRVQIEQALQVFKSAIQIRSLDELCQSHRDKLVFREEVSWPSIYHLRLLAWSNSWRTPENREMIARSIRRIVRLAPVPNIYVKYKSQLIAPASFCMQDFAPDLSSLTDAEWMQWFHRMELLGRLGVVQQIPELKRQVQALAEMLDEGQGLFTKKLSHAYFQKWGSYTGLALEKDWRVPRRRINDLTFRSLLLLHYAR